MDTEKRILVVEDDLPIREAMKELLELEGYCVRSAKNGQEGLDLLRSDPALPHVILLDLMMPVKDGFVFRMEQMDDPRLRHIPVVIMSADGNIQEKTRRTQAAGYLKKPVDLEDVLSALQEASALSSVQSF